MKRGFSVGLVACLVAVVLIAIFGRSSQEAEGLGTVSILFIIIGVVGYAAFKSAKADDLGHKVEELREYRRKQMEIAERSAHIEIPGLSVSIHGGFSDSGEAAKWVGSHVVIANDTITIRREA